MITFADFYKKILGAGRPEQSEDEINAWIGPGVSGQSERSRELMMGGTPKQEIQPANRALVHSAAVMEKRGIASGHHDVLSITMKRYVWPVDVFVNLAPLAEQAGPGLGHLWPAERSSDEAAGIECSGGLSSVATGEPPPYVGWAQAGGTLLLKRPRETSRHRPPGL